MKLLNLYLLFFIFFSHFSMSQKVNSLKENWISLFNGKDINNWIVKIHHHDVGINYGETFRVADRMIKVRYDQYEGDFNDQFGHLYYQQPYSHYRLKLQYRFTGVLHPGAPSYTLRNSGVMFHSQDPRTMPKEQNWPISVEMQFLGGLSDGNPRPTGNMCSPGTEVVYEGEIFPGHCINSTSDTYDGDQWVSAELIVLGDSLVYHLINGDTVLQYSKPQIGGGVVERYDPKIKWTANYYLRDLLLCKVRGSLLILRISGCESRGMYGPQCTELQKILCQIQPIGLQVSR
jgi:hypothetical protein